MVYPSHLSLTIDSNVPAAVSVSNLRKHAKIMTDFADMLEGQRESLDQEEKSHIDVSDFAKARVGTISEKATKRKYMKKAAAVTQDDDGMDLGQEDVNGEEELVSDDAPQIDEDEMEFELEEKKEEKSEPAKAKVGRPAAKLTLETHIIPAFQAFAKKHSREKAGAVLTKYKVKSVRDLPEAEYGKILRLLAV